MEANEALTRWSSSSHRLYYVSSGPFNSPYCSWFLGPPFLFLVPRLIHISESAFLDTFQFASSGCDSVTSFKYFIVHIVCLIYAMLCRCHWFWAHKATILANGKAHPSWLLDPFNMSSSGFEFFLSGTKIYYGITMSYPCSVTELAI